MAITRRNFLHRSAITAVGLGLASPLLEGVAFGKTPRGLAGSASDKIVVTINLYGGNDGLNTVIPIYQYDQYRRLRPTLGIDRERALALSGTPDLALNPGMTALRDLYATGKVAIVNGVGVSPDALGLYDHAAAQYEFQSGDVLHRHESSGPTGWLGRYLDTVAEGIVTPGIDFGGGRLLLTGSARQGLAIDSIDQFQIQPTFDTSARLASYQRIMEIRNTESAVAERNRMLRKDVLEKSAIVRDRTKDYEARVQYPSFDENYLAQSLYQCAQLIAADVGVRALSVYRDGFDTHANQNDGSAGEEFGYHDGLMKELSDAVAAFYNDLEAHGLADRVLILTISEFGRTPNQNADGGTDHGYGSVGFVVGGTVHGGAYGDLPGLDEEDFVLDGSVAVTTDIRSVYATILGNFLGADPEPVLGEAFPMLGFL